MNLDDLPSLRETLDAHGLSAKKSFGQHFLLDLNVTRKIARLAGPLTGRTVLEVGPGPGGLTRALLETDAARVVAVEKDPRFLPLLHELAEAGAGRLTVVEADALDVDEAALAGAEPWSVVANLPYNVGTPLLIKWLTRPDPPASLTLMFQQEVAERITAEPGTEAYGRLAVIAGAVSRAEIVMTLPARAFTPPPRVDSAVVRLDPRADRPGPADLARLERVTGAAFGQRRKMLRSSLKPLGGEDLCRAAGVDPAVRAETVDVAGFLRLAAAL
ncbi:MAG: 16S rRNA (adenine(1518)-N(6)/adenine(1519)-N(6))-dimethyltransferase RsmA [Proteobacteria bacterium]|nr:16S rRNA (adenine(1518)-N(6)/adenine(1519)-N(6))-dimethyltransferase RsmA [Pseudomonadota bacterium]MBW3616190.1 16S rRNA (adenine(1518)-N(6)/adenine(1519)-N(6))-dimethyltransferase RsmA [Pseudomonadota bacterium]